MATTVVALGYPSGTKVWKETDLEGTVLVVQSVAGTLFMIDVDNSANAMAASYVKLRDSNSAVTLGTTAPDDVLKVPGGARHMFHFEASGSRVGRAFANGLQAACVTAGGTGGTTNPTSAVVVHVIYS